jgi:hypothetical protein
MERQTTRDDNRTINYLFYPFIVPGKKNFFNIISSPTFVLWISFLFIWHAEHESPLHCLMSRMGCLSAKLKEVQKHIYNILTRLLKAANINNIQQILNQMNQQMMLWQNKGIKREIIITWCRTDDKLLLALLIVIFRGGDLAMWDWLRGIALAPARPLFLFLTIVERTACIPLSLG